MFPSHRNNFNESATKPVVNHYGFLSRNGQELSNDVFYVSINKDAISNEFKFILRFFPRKDYLNGKTKEIIRPGDWITIKLDTKDIYRKNIFLCFVRKIRHIEKVTNKKGEVGSHYEIEGAGWEYILKSQQIRYLMHVVKLNPFINSQKEGGTITGSVGDAFKEYLQIWHKEKTPYFFPASISEIIKSTNNKFSNFIGIESKKKVDRFFVENALGYVISADILTAQNTSIYSIVESELINRILNEFILESDISISKNGSELIIPITSIRPYPFATMHKFRDNSNLGSERTVIYSDVKNNTNKDRKKYSPQYFQVSNYEVESATFEKTDANINTFYYLQQNLSLLNPADLQFLTAKSSEGMIARFRYRFFSKITNLLNKNLNITVTDWLNGITAYEKYNMWYEEGVVALNHLRPDIKIGKFFVNEDVNRLGYITTYNHTWSLMGESKTTFNLTKIGPTEGINSWVKNDEKSLIVLKNQIDQAK